MAASDDEGFGDFTFAPSNQTIQSNQTMLNGPAMSFSNDDDDDDGWGDFINSSGLNHTLSLPRATKPLDPFGLATDQNQNKDSVPTQPGSAPSRVDSGTMQWEKPKGALPLSIFGELEEEDESGVVNPSLGGVDGANLFSDKNKNVDSAKKGSGLNVNDLIANLYKQNEPVNESKLLDKNNVHEENSDLNMSVSKMDAIEPNSNSHSFDSNWRWINSNGNGLNLNGTSEPNSNSKGLNLDWSTSNLISVGLNTKGNVSTAVVKDANWGTNGVNSGLVDGNEGFDDDDGWEFKGAESKTAVGGEISKTNQIKTENGPMSNPNGFDSSWNARNLDFNGLNPNFDEVNSDANCLNTGPVSKNEALGEEYVWELNDVDSKTQVFDENIKNGQTKTKNESMLKSTSGWDVLNLDSSKLGLSRVNPDKNHLNSGLVDENKDFDDADGRGFKSADSELPIMDDSYEDNQIAIKNGQPLNLNGTNSSLNISGLYGDGMNSNLKGMNSGTEQVNLNSFDENEDFAYDDEWEFKAAESEYGTVDRNTKGDERLLENSEGANTFGLGNAAHGSGDLFGASQRTAPKAGEWGFGFDFNPSSLIQDTIISGAYSKSEQNNVENGLDVSPVDVRVDPDGNSWAYMDAFSESGSKEEPKDAEISPAVEASDFNGEIQVVAQLGNKASSNEQKGALPLSIFGDEEKEADDPVIYQGVSDQMPKSKSSDGIKNAHLNISVDDLISSLYSQAEQNLSINHSQNPSENESGSTGTVSTSNLANDYSDSWEFKDASSGTRAEHLMSSLYSQAEQNASINLAWVSSENGFGSTRTAMASNLANCADGSCEFKDVSPGTRADDQTSILIGESHTKCSTKVDLNDYVNFFSKTKEELHFVVLCHHENLKKAQSAAASAGDNARVQALDREIQDLDSELHQDGIVNGEVYSENHSPGKISINQFIEVLRQPKFQVFESEYQLSKKLSLVENDLRSAIELLKHVESILKILTLIPREGQSSYVSTWSKMLAVCAQELKCGALIWKQSLQKNLCDQILSEPRGKNYILALGEIYRVVEVLGSSVRLYKPWILASSTDPMGMFALLTECSSLWSNSGLEEALWSISDPASFAYDGNVKALLESIKYIHDLDTLALYNHVVRGQEPTCRLSVLTAGTMPGMKSVLWNGDCYFVTLANLWANLICRDPPSLPLIIHAGR